MRPEKVNLAKPLSTNGVGVQQLHWGTQLVSSVNLAGAHASEIVHRFKQSAAQGGD